MLIHIHTPHRPRTIDTTRVRQLDTLATALTRRVLDAEFDESEHPRAPDGKFTAGGGVGPKPTSHTAKSIKGGLHQLLSTGHPFSIEELQAATGVKSPAMMAAYLSDLKNPKYAPKEGHLAVVKRSDGMYHVVQEAAITKAAPTPAPKADVTVPTVVRVTRDPGEGTQHWVKLPGDDREFPLVRGDATFGLGTVWTPGVGGAWDDYAMGPAPSQNGYISQNNLGETKEEALRNLPELVKRLDASPHYSSKAKLEHSREHQKSKTYNNLTAALDTVDDPKLKDRLDEIIDSARINADDTVDIERAAKPNEWDAIFKGTVESILSSGETNRRVHEFFKTHSTKQPAVERAKTREPVKQAEKTPQQRVEEAPALPAGKDFISTTGIVPRGELPVKMPTVSPKHWAAAKQEHVELASIKSGQGYLSRAKLLALLKDKPQGLPPLNLFRHKGQLYLADGNHRSAAAILTGQQQLPAAIIDLDHQGRMVLPDLKKAPEAPKPAKHTRVPNLTYNGLGGEYTTTPVAPLQETHRIAGKDVKAYKEDVYHNGQKIGTVNSYVGYKDGPKINAAGVVAWRKDVVQHRWNLDKGHHHPMGSSGEGRYSSKAEAIRGLQYAHAQKPKD